MKNTISFLSLALALFAAAAAGCNQGKDVPSKAVTNPTRSEQTSQAAPADDIFGTPGGKYTAEDIKVNGDQTPMQKYKKVGHAEGGDAVVGDKLCPVSNDKANPAVTWMIGGKKYEFCCAPCIKTFVKTAKEHPEDVKAPSEYVKK